MSYKINKTDGILLVDLIDGRIDILTTDLVLIGRNFTGYGELFNENFIKLLENFAAVSPPSKPLEGQLWYDKSNGRLKVWNGLQFRSTDTTVVSSTEPQLLAGDIWIDSRRQQLYFNDGIKTTLAGPIFTRDQGPTGFKVETITDRFGNPKTVAKIIVNSTELALISREPFEAALSQPGFGKNIQEGINISSNRPDFEFRGTATRARELIGSTGLFTPDEFLKKGPDPEVTTGSLHINNDSGLRIGNNVSFLTRMLVDTVINEVVTTSANYRLVVTRNINNTPTPTDAFFVNTQEQRIGLWTDTPSTSLDVNGSLRVAGDLIVEGNTTVLEVENLKIQDKLIELATTASSTIGDNIAVDNAGITVLSSDGSKDWVWRNSTNSWTSNVNINIPYGLSYKIGNQSVLFLEPFVSNPNYVLADFVTKAPGITQLGKLDNLDVANFEFSSSTIKVSDSLTIDSADDIIILNSKKITGVSNPIDPQDVATKNYVDNVASSEPVRLSMDITGLTDVQIGLRIKALYPAGTRVFGTKAFIDTSAYSGSVVTNPTAQTTKSFVAVDSGGVQNQSVVQDFNFTNATNTVTLTVTRGFKTYTWNNIDWVIDP
jgi:hypothetical protein